MNVSAWQSVLSGSRSGVLPSFVRGGLSLASPFYHAGVTLRNLAYDRGWKQSHSVDRPVISVGNITTGGTGKTPLVAWLVNELHKSQRTPVILSRGYRSLSGGENDEKRLLDQLCPGTVHVQNPDRVAAARQICRETSGDVIVLDDGFQHRRLVRDLDLVLIDALNPWGYGKLLPRGLLREPKSSLSRADVVIMTRADQINEETRDSLKTEISRWADLFIAECAFEPTSLVSFSGSEKTFAEVDSESVGAFCGIGNPAGFRRTLCRMGLPVTENRFRIFPDHHDYSEQDIIELKQWAAERRIETLLTTRKDLVKIPCDQVHGIPLWAVEISTRFLSGRDGLMSRISQCLHGDQRA